MTAGNLLVVAVVQCIETNFFRMSDATDRAFNNPANQWSLLYAPKGAGPSVNSDDGSCFGMALHLLVLDVSCHSTMILLVCWRFEMVVSRFSSFHACSEAWRECCLRFQPFGGICE